LTQSGVGLRFAKGLTLRIAAWGLLLVVLLPVLAVLAGGIASVIRGDDVTGRLIASGTTTFLLVCVVTGFATAIGAGGALLVAGWRFPGSGFVSWAMVLPLAAPSYIVGYAWGDLTAPGRFLAVLPVSGFFGAAFVLTLTLFPYAYLAMRAALAAQSVCSIEAARTLGASHRTRLWQVTLPQSRPALVAGAALISMEAAADYGTVSYFGVGTFSSEIVRTWFSMGNALGAMQLASILMIAAMGLILFERQARGRTRTAGGSNRWRTPDVVPLTGALGWGALAFCTLPVLLGFVVPMGQLLLRAVDAGIAPGANLEVAALHSLTLAAIGGALTLLVCITLAGLGRKLKRVGRTAPLLLALGYAAPGVVVSLGAITAFGWAREAGIVGGLVGVLALAVLIWTYATRFAAAGLTQIDAGLEKATPNLAGAARTLGARGFRRFVHVELPIAAPAAFAAGLMVFVEIMKELPATLILRPFDFETLATRAYGYAADERLAQAAFPSLLIGLVGLVPVILLARALRASRPGTRTSAKYTSLLPIALATPAK
jgi:iron(III) transport system permease protein